MLAELRLRNLGSIFEAAFAALGGGLLSEASHDSTGVWDVSSVGSTTHSRPHTAPHTTVEALEHLP
jgi:hypothetical protein